ncbi:magnesium and cobalt transport protein CorA [Saccharothrix xinjiangensis]|uniref:Magnesium and cobalt transport protein CorA n=1 Tax=Saccharothrix xinjiangensis TaxID=204798 RepID=A0ABV9Y2K5_9PSEU
MVLPAADGPGASTTTRDSVVACGVYVDGLRRPGRRSPVEAIAEVRALGRGFAWIGLVAPDRRRTSDIADALALPESAVEDAVHAVHAHRRPKLERHEGSLLMVLKTVGYVEHESPTTANEIVESGEVVVFLGADYVLTVCHSDFATLREELERQPERLATGPAAVLHAVVDHVVDGYLDVVDAVQNDIDHVEAAVFAPRSEIGVEQLYLVKREIVELKRAIVPLAGPLRALSAEPDPLVPDAIRSYFRNVEDHLTAAAERVAGHDELITTLVNATLAKVSLQQNNDMRRISAWVAIVAVPTMVFGNYGMNFDHMPELRWAYGYPLVLTSTLIACLVLHHIFKRNHWL